MAAIQKLHETDMAAAKIQDFETLITLCADDCIMLPPGQEAIVGKDAIWAFMQESADEENQFEILEYVHNFDEVKLVGEWAYEWGTFRGAYRPVEGGDTIRVRQRLFRILQRQSDESWKVARAMWHDLPVDEE